MSRHSEADDSGFTLLEVLIGMTILSIFLAIFGGSMINIFTSVNHTQQTADAQSQVNQLFETLDREVRYASGISQPGVNAGGDPVVEFVSSYTGTPVCTELRVSPSGTLQQRTWGQNDAPIVPSTPSFLAANVAADAPVHTAASGALVYGPFALVPATGTASNQQLEIAINARDTGLNTVVRHFDVTFTALNTATSTSSNSVCSQGRSIAWPSP